MKCRVTFVEELLGTASANPEIHREFIASKSPDAGTIEDEVAAIGVNAVEEKSRTIFSRIEGKPFLYDYQIKGFFKDAAKMLRMVKGTETSKLTSYKTIIDGLVFVYPRKVVLNMPKGGVVGDCQRPLRAETAQGPRVCLASSETVPKGSTFEMDVTTFSMNAKKKKGEEPTEAADLTKCIVEWLDYGAMRGIGQWRNSGKGRFSWEAIG